jgi:hypothetical protein
MRARDALTKIDNVVGVGFGPKLTRGRVTKRHAFIVLVTEKKPPKELPNGYLIPAEIEGFATDVREPKLTLDEQNPTDEPPSEELSDYQWIDWGKIHQMRLRQQMHA